MVLDAPIAEGDEDEEEEASTAFSASGKGYAGLNVGEYDEIGGGGGGLHEGFA